MRRTSCALMFDLAIEQRIQLLAKIYWRDHQFSILALLRESGQVVEQLRRVSTDRVINGKHSEICVSARGRGIVITGSDVNVASQCFTFAPYNERAFAVSLQPENAIDHVNASFVELASPLDVVLLIETRFQLD